MRVGGGQKRVRYAGLNAAHTTGPAVALQSHEALAATLISWVFARFVLLLWTELWQKEFLVTVAWKKPFPYPGFMLARNADRSMFACFGAFEDVDAGRNGEAGRGPGRFLPLCSGMLCIDIVRTVTRQVHWLNLLLWPGDIHVCKLCNLT